MSLPGRDRTPLAAHQRPALGIALGTGRVALEGSHATLLPDPGVQPAYLDV